MCPEADSPGADRQRVERVPGRRRARLTRAPGTSGEPVPEDETTEAPTRAGGASGPNDEQLRRDVPPHY
jgi:hypothetical protein